jgi:UDP-N-acetylmuramoyl-tripeptide--D-alanyl-D-alanine ligase
MTGDLIAVVIIGSAIISACAVVAAYDYLNNLQLCSYNAREYFVRIKSETVFRTLILAVAAASLQLIFDVLFYDNPLLLLLGFIGSVGLTAAFVFLRKKKRKTPTKFTPRMIRLYITTTVLTFGVTCGLLFFGVFVIPRTPTAFSALAVAAVIPIIAAAAFVNYPIEKINNYRYLRRAREKLRSRTDLKIIGITGSFGKTTLKNFLNDILCKHFNTYATPASFNTPMGITKAINTKLQDFHEIFIVEMGARRIGDIRELCALAPPDVAVITAVGSQHLDTFKSRENIAVGKYEIVKHAKEGALNAFNGDNAGSYALYGGAPHPKILAAASTRPGKKTAEYSEVSASNSGSKFRLTFENGYSEFAETLLIGEHNISNIALAAAIAFKLGVPTEKIVAAIGDIKPVPHRLQLVPSSNKNLTIIDDSYNACPESIDAAFNVAKMFSGIKAVITRVLVEQGAAQAEENITMGRKMAAVFDYCFVSGRNSPKLIEGLLAADFPNERIFECLGTDDAAAKLAGLNLGKTVVLFSNDLPDNY